MSVLIKNMNMPMDCGVCPFYYKEACAACDWRYVSDYNRRPKWCPLVDIPQHIEKKIDKEIDEYNAPLGVAWKKEVE